MVSPPRSQDRRWLTLLHFTLRFQNSGSEQVKFQNSVRQFMLSAESKLSQCRRAPKP